MSSEQDDTKRRTEADTLDLRGLKCPLPVLRTRKALARLKPGEKLTVSVTDPMAAIDLPNLVRETGDRLLDIVRDAREIRFVLEKR